MNQNGIAEQNFRDSDQDQTNFEITVGPTYSSNKQKDLNSNEDNYVEDHTRTN